MQNTYTVSLPVKPYVLKYVQTIEGSPLQFNSSGMLCMIVRAYMENKNSYIQVSKEKMAIALSSRTASLEIIVPMSKQYLVGTSMRPSGIVLINRFLEDCFERALSKFIKDNVKAGGRYKGYKETYYAFADLYNVVLEQDITYDGLKQMDFRSRKKKDENNPNNFVEYVPSL